MLVLGSLFNLVEPVLTVAAALSVQSPFLRSTQHNAECSAARQPLYSDLGDPFTLLNTFNAWVQVKGERGGGSRKWCKRRGIEEQRLYEMANLRQQFKELLKSHCLLEPLESPTRHDRAERNKRLTERQRLHQLKREYERHESSHRKVLDLHEGLEEEPLSGSDDEGSGSNKREKDPTAQGIDIQEVKFKLRHDVTKLQGDAYASAALTPQQQSLFRLVVCHGLYPQLALPDEHNATRKDSEQVFHTCKKQGIVIHPCSVFASCTEVLHITEQEYSEIGGVKGQSNRHQLLAFVTLIETNKPYVSNCVRVPALQALLLVGNSVDSNADCTRLVVDGWLELVLADSEAALRVISSALTLRERWDKLLQAHLNQARPGPTEVGVHARVKASYREVQKLEEELVRFLVYTEISYSLRRITTLESKNMYIGPQSNAELSHPQLFPGMKAEPNPIKGGLSMTGYFTYNCLCDSKDLYSECLRTFWTCPHCSVYMPFTPLERIQHEATCRTKEEQQPEEDPDPVTSAPQSSLTRPYRCDICDKVLTLTPTEILKHKRQHMT